jgi:hypothetical protein
VVADLEKEMVSIVRAVRAVLIVFLVLFIGAQFVRPDRTNPASPAGASLLSKAPPQVAAIIDRSCRDCHTNDTRWPWYTNITPMNWLVANHVQQGREHVNFSTWSAYDEDDQDKFLGGICSLTKRGRMPLPSYLFLHRDTKLSDSDVAALCAWSEKMRDMLQ